MLRTISVAALAVVLGSGAAWAQFRTVTVQNAPSNPVPTTVQNTVPVTGTVNVGGGTVGVTGPVAVTGSVGIAGTPSVNVANTPNVAVTSPVGTAGPGNTTGVLVKDLDNPARQPFQRQLACATVVGGSTTCTDFFNVPVGKELVIEYVQFLTNEFAGSTAVELTLNTSVGPQNLSWVYAPGTKLSSSFAVSEHQVRIYCDPTNSVQLSGTESSNIGLVGFSALVSGYMVNVP